jgi:membrane protein
LTTSPRFLLSISGVLTLWSAKNAMAAIMNGLNAMYGLEDSRSYLKKNAVALLLTIGLAASILVSGTLQLLGTEAGQDIADWAGLETVWSTAVRLLQWPVTAALVTLVIVMIHRFAPIFDGPLRWYLPGASLTTIGLAVSTLGLQIYFASFGGFSAAYGVFGAVLAFIFWLYVVSVVILAGGVVNATLFAIDPRAKTALADYLEAKILGYKPGQPETGTHTRGNN